ncbi:MAG: DASS family sodium-coupled anion symporter [Candidatus Neomarinimicrobiota bacterium]|nr:DASS family sodium-coupled anion symporter [Candidatus Neomarinimicrobiota bacterium]
MLVDIIYWATQRKWLLIALLFGAVLYLLPTPHGLTSNGYHTLIIVLITILLIIYEPIPLPAVAMLILIFQVLFGIATPNEVAASFMSDAVFFIMGSLMLAVAIVSQGLDTRLALGIINITGHKTWRIVAGFVTVCAVLSSFIGEHTVTAMMMPVGLTLVRHTSSDPKKIARLTALILFSIAYGSAMGSIGTPSGGGRNVIIMGYLSQFGMGSLSYLQWMKYAYPVLLVEIPLAVMLLWWTFRPEKTILDSAVRKLKVQVAKSGNITGRQLVSIGVFVLVFLGWVFLSPTIGLGIIALFGVVLYLAFGLVEWQDLNRNTNWGVIMLFGAAISLGLQMKDTGAALWVATKVIETLKIVTGDLDIIRSFVSIFLTAGLTNFLSSAATVAVLGPIVLNMGGDAVIITLATALASAFGYMTVVASPTCMIIHSSGLVKPSDYFRGGWKMTLMSIAVLFLFIHLFWPLLG